MDEQHGLIFGARVGYTGKFSIYMYQTITFYQLHQELLMLTCAITGPHPIFSNFHSALATVSQQSPRIATSRVLEHSDGI